MNSQRHFMTLACWGPMRSILYIIENVSYDKKFRCIFCDNLSKYITMFFCHTSGPVFCLLLGVSSDFAQPITGQVTEVTCPVIGQAQPELTPSKRQKTGPKLCVLTSVWPQGKNASPGGMFIMTLSDPLGCQEMDMWVYDYRQVSNINRTKSQHLKDSCTVLRLSLPNPLKPDVKSRMKM